ncbi:MAG: extensin family protein [Rhabdaerophilum sp.]
MLRSGHALSAITPAVRLCLAFLASAAFLSGCGFVKYEQREAWRGQAEIACMKAGIVKESATVRITKPIDGAGACGLDIPLKVQAFQNDQSLLQSFANLGVPNLASTGTDLRLTVLKPEATLTCPMVAWVDDWLNTSVQPAALAWFGQPVKEIRSGGSYNCRRRNHQPGARLSEHAFGNALDIMAFVLTDGSVVTVKGGWRGTEAERGFLRETLHSACDKFRTVLGPGSDAFHHDHFHIDLARHDTKGTRRYCRPKLEAPMRPAIQPHGQPQMPPITAFGGQQAVPPQASQAPVVLSQRPPQPMTAPRAPLQGGDLQSQANRLSGEVMETEEEFDPRDFDVTSSVSELPGPRRRATMSQPLPGSSPAILPQPRSMQPAEPRREGRTVPRQPAAKVLMPPIGN